MKKRLSRIFFSGFARCGKILFEALFVLLAVIAPWCFGAFFCAFDLPEFAIWIAIILLFASLIASLFFRWSLALAAVVELATITAYCLIAPE